MIILNREKRRKFIKEAKKKNIPKEYINAYLELMNSKEAKEDIKEGEKVLVNVERITSGKSFESMNDGYKEFVNRCKDRVYTAHIEDSGLISLKESPGWLFWEGDLIKCRGDDI